MDSVSAYIQHSPELIKQNMFMNKWEVLEKILVQNKINPYTTSYKLYQIRVEFQKDEGLIKKNETVDLALTRVYLPGKNRSMMGIMEYIEACFNNN